MTCTHCVGAGAVFNDRAARRSLSRYRKRGPARTTRWLLEALVEPGVEGLTVLDVGGGVGAIQHELLDAGAARAVGVDASPAYLEAARNEARRRGHQDRSEQHLGDFVDRARDLPDADLVTLDRVLCCYPDVETLVDASASKARRAWAVVFPRDTWWVRALLTVPNAWMRLTRNPFRVFAHPTPVVDRAARRQGLELDVTRRSLFWQVAVYRRPAAAHG